ncbi:bacteriohemerythrin [Acidovorax soli]|jgi:hemerythrin|uniref:bacteriohemerythrin n=1 Tax=Acidovorax soli TaxID=592050 RepID=UPI0032B1314B
MMENLNVASGPSSPTAAGLTGGSTMAWSDRYLLGHNGMDDTHREFVECVAALQLAQEADLAECLAAFETHAVEHFEQERLWMDSTAFPAAQCHVDEHTAVLDSVHEVQEMLRQGAAGQVARDLARALADWFPGHADYMDASLAQWLVKRSHGGVPVVLRRRLDPVDAPVPPEAN